MCKTLPLLFLLWICKHSVVLSQVERHKDSNPESWEGEQGQKHEPWTFDLSEGSQNYRHEPHNIQVAKPKHEIVNLAHQNRSSQPANDRCERSFFKEVCSSLLCHLTQGGKEWQWFGRAAEVCADCWADHLFLYSQLVPWSRWTAFVQSRCFKLFQDCFTAGFDWADEAAETEVNIHSRGK